MTTKLRRLAQTLGNSGSLQEAALKAGYAPSTARAQDSITSRKGFQEILRNYLPLEEAFKVTKDGMKANKIYSPPDEPSRVIPDHAIRIKAADQVYKLHNVLQPDQTHIGDNVMINIEHYGDNDQLRHTEITTGNGNSPESSPLQDIELAPQSP